jgi:hypothetical protein
MLDPNDDYSTEIIRSKFTRDLASTFEEVRGELFMAIDDLIPTNEHGTQYDPTRGYYEYLT